MKKIILIFLISILTFFSFSEKKNNKPENIIRYPILRMTDNGYRLIWNNNRKSTVYFAEKGNKG